MKRALSKLPDLTKDERRVVEHMTKMIARKLMREPMMRLNHSAGTGMEEFYIEAARRLFKLDMIGEKKSNDKKQDSGWYAQQ